MSNKKILIMTAAFIMSVLTFSGCGKEETNPASAESGGFQGEFGAVCLSRHCQTDHRRIGSGVGNSKTRGF